MFETYEESVWSEAVFAVTGSVSGKITGYRYKETSADKPLYAAGNKPLSIQKGNKGFTGNFKMLKGDFDSLTIAAKAAGASSVTGIAFDVTVTYLPAVGRPVMQDTWSGFTISSYEKGWDQGATEMMINCDGNFLDLITNP